MKTYEITTKVAVFTTDELTAADRALVEAAKEATQNSYSPYSQFRVGAAVRLADGTLLTGSNQENAAYPSGLCAERTALFYAGHRYPTLPVTALAIAACGKHGFLSQPIPPCGACRQVMLETEERHHHPMRLLLYSTEGVHVVTTARALLPLEFVGSTMG